MMVTVSMMVVMTMVAMMVVMVVMVMMMPFFSFFALFFCFFMLAALRFIFGLCCPHAEMNFVFNLMSLAYCHRWIFYITFYFNPNRLIFYLSLRLFWLRLGCGSFNGNLLNFCFFNILYLSLNNNLGHRLILKHTILLNKLISCHSIRHRRHRPFFRYTQKRSTITKNKCFPIIIQPFCLITPVRFNQLNTKSRSKAIPCTHSIYNLIFLQTCRINFCGDITMDMDFIRYQC